MSPPIDLIIDCDPGIDDALALFIALAAPRRLRLLGITCVAGNRPVDTTVVNAGRLLAAAGRPEVPVFRGAAGPVDGTPARCNLVHGEDGLGGVAMPAGVDAASEPAVDFLVRSLEAAPPHSLTIAAIGPLTNLALAEQRRPGVLSRAKALAIMGGAVQCPGNVTPEAEFNFYADPLAAQQVLSCGATVQLFGLDVTSKAVMSNAWIAALGEHPGRCSQWARQMLVAYAALDPLLHDACPIAWLLDPRLFRSASWRLSVDCQPGAGSGRVRGEPVDRRDRVRDGDLVQAGRSPSPAVSVVFDLDNDALLALTLDHLRRLP